MEGEELFDQVLVERSGTYELVDSRLLTPDLVERSSPLMSAPSPTEEAPVEAPGEAPEEAQPALSAPSPPPPPAAPATQSSSPPSSPPSPPPDITPPVQQPAKPPQRRPGSAARKVTRPASARSLKSSSQPHLYNDHYKQFERSTPKRAHPARPMSARPPSPKKKLQEEDRLAVERRDMADAAFEHWKRTKDREIRRRRSEERKTPGVATAGQENEQRSDEAFKSWLASKSRQKSKQRQTEQIRAKIITSELLSVDYSESEHAFERWLREKNRRRQEELRERQRKCQVDREEMKVVLQNLKTRWTIDYKQSHYLHPNIIRKAWDKSPLYSTNVLPW